MFEPLIEQGRISNVQATMLSITSLTIMGHLIILTLVLHQSRQDGWIASIIGSLCGLIGMAALTKLSQRYPGLTLIEILYRHFSWPGKVLAGCYLGYFFIMTVLATRLFGEAYKIIMGETPIIAFITVIMLLTSYIVYLGLETIGRMNQLMLPILVIIAVAVAYLTMSNKDYANLLPIMGNGLLPIGQGAVSVMGWFNEFAIMGMIIPYVQHPQKILKFNLIAGVFTLLFFLGPITGPIAMFGAEEAANMTFPTFSEVRYIEAGEVLNRFDAIAVLFWTVGLMFRISIFFYGLVLGTGQFFKLDSYRPLVIPFAWLIGASSMWFADNTQELSEFLYLVYVPFNIAMGTLFPVLFLLLGIVLARLKTPPPTPTGSPP